MPEIFVTPSQSAIKAALSDGFTTTHAVLFHTLGNRHFMTAHDVKRSVNDGGIHIEPGRFFSPKDESRLLDRLIESRSKQPIIVFGPDILIVSGTTVVWHIPGAYRPMHLKISGETKTIETMWPSLIACVHEGSLFLVAVKGNARPDATTRLFHAPLGNVYSNTAVCTGNVSLPSTQGLQAKQEWDAVIFDSAFTHVNHGSTIKKDNADSEFWAKRDHKKTFNESLLVDTGMSLSNWVSKITRD